MSVKDRIAMWNSMSMNSNTTNPTHNAPKVTASTFTSKPAQQQQEPMRASENPTKSHQVQAVTIVKPSDLKKKAQMQQGPSANKLPEYATKPIQPSYKQPEAVKRENSNSNTTNQVSIQSPTIPKPSDIKKQLEQKISGNNFHLIAPTPIKKVDSITVELRQETKVQYEVEREVPRVNVKQSAQKLGMFYQKKNEELTKPKEVVPVPEVQEQKHHYVPPSQNSFVLPPQHNEIPSPPAQASEAKEEQTNQEMDLALRLKNRNKKRRVNFDSDED